MKMHLIILYYITSNLLKFSMIQKLSESIRKNILLSETIY